MNAKPSSPRFDADREVPTGPIANENLNPPNESVGSDANDSPGPGLKIDYPAELPIAARVDEITTLIRDHQVVVVCGETGSGKSTQLPKICIDAGLGGLRSNGRRGRIGHTQPRRLAARSVATRIAEETQSRLGEAVGFQVRFGDQTGDSTIIKLMTDGILLAETTGDRSLSAYDAIIIDEAHERSLNIDFLIGYLRSLCERRDDLKIILTSATIDAERFAEHFRTPDRDVPIVNVEGRGYPVAIDYLPWEDVVEDDSRTYDLSRHVIAGLNRVTRSTDGDVLVFMPTERDIRLVSHQVAGHYTRMGLAERVELLPLYARLPTSQQQRIFKPSGQTRRIIFATNVAESSLTVPRISAVIDTGTARISRYSSRSRVLRLPVESISKASANQRAGRCGRIGPGICVRLYAESDFDSRSDYTTPEIRRTNLASVVLQMKSMRIGDIESFPFLDPPRPEAIREANKTLFELGAIGDGGDLTEIGQRLGRMPVDPRVGRMLVAAEDAGVITEVLPIAASLELPDVRDRPIDRREQADQAHATHVNATSDFLTTLNLWRHYQNLKSDLSRSALQRRLKRDFLSPTRMREWSDIVNQLRDAMRQSRRNRKRSGAKTRHKSEPTPPADDQWPPEYPRELSESIHRALLTGLLHGVATIRDRNEYVGAGGQKSVLWPGSGLSKQSPKWIMAAEVVETSRTFARTVAKIQPAWVEHAAAHLIKRHHADPHWSDRAGGAFCYENQTLYGLPVVTRRRVPLGPLDPTTARDLLIQHGLAERRMRTSADFVRFNQQLCDHIESIGARLRDNDFIVDAYDVVRFYAARLPADVCDAGRLSRYAKTLSRPDWAAGLNSAAGVSTFLADPPPRDPEPSTPYARPDDLIAVDVDDATGESVEAAYPDRLDVGDAQLPLQYRYAPGTDSDGVGVTIHAAAVPQISDAKLDWLVPGMMTPKITAIIKSLPKRIRRNLVPTAEIAQKIADDLMPVHGRVPFAGAVCEAMSKYAEMTITPDDIRWEKLDNHHRMLVTVVGDDGTTVAQSRSVSAVASAARRVVGGESVSASSDRDDDPPFKRTSMKTFDIEQLPATWTAVRGGVEVVQYPGFRIKPDTISTTLYPDRDSAERSIRDATTRLFALRLNRDLKSQVKHLPALADAKLKIGGMLGGHVESSLVVLMARIAMVEHQKPVRSAEEFERRVGEKSRRIPEAAVELSTWLATFARDGFAARREFESFKRGTAAHVIDDVTRQMTRLIFEGYLDRVPWSWLQHYPRYHAAIAYRLEKYRSAASRDAQSMETVQRLTNRMIESRPADRCTPADLAEDEIRWMIEELRVSLFAQTLGTAMKISPTRIEKTLDDRTKRGGI